MVNQKEQQQGKERNGAGDTFLKVCSFTRQEIEYLIQECNFTDAELELFNMRCKDITLEQCAEKMNVSVSTIYRINKKMKKKIMKVI